MSIKTRGKAKRRATKSGRAFIEFSLPLKMVKLIEVRAIKRKITLGLIVQGLIERGLEGEASDAER